MVQEGIVLGQVVSHMGIKAYRAKIEVIKSLPFLTLVEEIRSFLSYVGFDCHFINDVSMITKPLT